MPPSLGRVLLIVGIVLIVIAIIAHFALTSLQIFPHFNIVLGAIGIIVAAIGLYGMISRPRAA